MRAISFVRLSRRAAVLMLLLFMATVTYAQFTPSDDSYVNSAAPTTNYGSAKTLDLSSAAETIFIRFDLTAVPSGYTGSSIAKATLKLFVDSVTKAGSFNVDLVNGTWAEKTIDYSNQPSLGTTIAASVPLTTTSKLDYVEVDITQAVVEWLNGTANDGIALVANSPLVATFDSKEATTTSHPAELNIVFASGGTITGITTASGSGLIGGGTSGTLNLSLINTCSANQVLQWNGTAWACASAGAGTITGVTAGTDLTGGGTSGNVTLNLNTSLVPQLSTPNTFTGNQTVSGNLSATGLVTGAAFNIGSNLFAFGSYSLQNAFLGFAGNTATTGEEDTASGLSALQSNTTGSANTAAGYQALAANTTGNNNTASGAQALVLNTTGYQNTASGVSALYSNTTGSNNTASGAQALLANTTGNNNTATGFGALYFSSAGYNNSAHGYRALYNSTGSSNTASGAYSLFSNAAGNENTADGYNALYYNATGSYNTALGFNAGPDKNSTALVNTTAIGANAVVSESNALVLGGTGSNAVNVGIGTATPAYALDVHGTGNFTGLVNFASGQQFPGAGTITGVTAGTALTGGGTTGNVTLNVDTTKVVTGVVAGTDLTGGGTGGVQTLNLDTTKVPQLAAANTFTGTQTINNYVTIEASGNFAALNVNGSAGGVSGSGTNIGLQGVGTSQSQSYGVYGEGWSAGVIGYGSTSGETQGTGVEGVSSGYWGTGVYGIMCNSCTYGYGVWGIGYPYAIFASGNIGATGTITGGLALRDDRVVSVYAMQSPENWLEDFGSGKLRDGVAAIEIEATFAQTVNTAIEYHVFLTPKGDCKGLYVTNETATGFEVRELGSGQSSVAFDYRIVAKRKGLENLRLEDQHADHETAEAIRQFIATRQSKILRLKFPKHPEPPQQAAVHEPPKMEPPKLAQQPPVPAPPRTKPPVPQPHVAVPEAPK